MKNISVNLENLSEEERELLLGLIEKGNKKVNPFDKQESEKYYIIEPNGGVQRFLDTNDSFDHSVFNTANYCTDKEIMEKRALQEILNRLLWRFKMVNDDKQNSNYIYEIVCKVDNWSDFEDYKETGEDIFKPYAIGCAYKAIGTMWFSTVELAEKAIKEIVMPFIKENNIGYSFFAK